MKSCLVGDGQYRIEDIIIHASTNRNCEVFIARDEEDEKLTVIVKTLVEIDNLKRFNKEAKILDKLQGHYGIPELIRGDGNCRLSSKLTIPYFIMEKIGGVNLKKWLERKTRIDEEQYAWEWLRKITYILAHVHDLGYSHRDIKPANIMTDGDGRFVLIDYDSAVDEKVPGANTTDGTVEYGSPEQFNGSGDYQSDFYALGQTFYQLTTGNSPKNKQPGEDWGKDTNFPNSPMINLIDWMTKTPRGERPQSTGEILHAINLFENSYTREEAKSFIQNRSQMPELERIKFRSELLDKDQLIQEQSASIGKINEQLQLQESQLQSKYTELINRNQQIQNRDVSIDRINNQLYRTRRTLADRRNSLKKRDRQLRTVVIKLNQLFIAGGLIVLISVGSVVNSYLQKSEVSQQLNEANKNVTELTRELNSQSITGTKLSPVPIVSEFFISSGEKYKVLFATNVSGNRKATWEEACANFRKGEKETKAPEKSKYYEAAFEGFKTLYEKNRNDPQLPLYINNSKIRYLLSKGKIRSEQILKIAVPSPATLETGQHILAGVALKQQLLLNPELESSDPMKNDVNSIGSIDPTTNTIKTPAFYLEVVIADEDKPEHAKELAQKLIKEHGDITAVIGHYTTEAMNASLEVYANAPIAVISPTASGYGLNTYSKDENVFFRTISSTNIEAHSWVKFLKSSYVSQSDLKNIVVFYQADIGNTTFSQSMFERFKYWANKEKIQLNDNLILKNLFDYKLSELDDFFKKIPPDSIIIIIPKGKKGVGDPVFAKTTSILSSLGKKENQGKVKYIIGSNPLFSASDVLAETLDKLKDKLIIGVDWDADCSSGDRSKFRQDLQIFTSGDLDRRTASSFEDVQVLSYLFKKIQDTNKTSSNIYRVTRKNIIDGLRNLGSEEIVSEVFNDARHISFEKATDGNKNINIGDRKESVDRILVKPSIVYKKNANGTDDVPVLAKFTSFTKGKDGNDSCELIPKQANQNLVSH